MRTGRRKRTRGTSSDDSNESDVKTKDDKKKRSRPDVKSINFKKKGILVG